MRKALIAVIVASALFAVGAFAASFTLTTENVASNSAAVGSCADEAVVNFTTSAEISTTSTPHDFLVTGVTVTFRDDLDALETDCDGAKADLAINSGTVESPVWFDAGSVPVGSGVAEFTGLTLPVKPIIGVAVLVDGKPIPTPPV